MKTSEVIHDPGAAPKFSSYDVFSILSILLLPFILVVINDNWIFQSLNGLDRWIYSGFHLHLREFLRTFGHTYYASRVPWTIAGWLVHSVFDDAIALYVLHFAVFYLAVFSLYAAIRIMFANVAAAAAAALLLGTHSYFLRLAGWDHVIGASLGFMLAAFAALAGAAIQQRWRLAAFVWGVATCAMVSLYVLLVLLVPVQIGLFLLLKRVRGDRPLFVAAAWFAAGGASATLLLCLINLLLGGPFLYFMGQIDALLAVANNRFRWDAPFVEWASSAPWLLVPAIIFGFSCLYVLLRLRRVLGILSPGGEVADPQAMLILCCLADISASLIYVGLQIDHFYVLQMHENACALLPFAYLTIGGALSVMISPSGLPRQFGFLAAVAAIVLVPWLLATFGYIFPGVLFGENKGSFAFLMARWELFDSLMVQIGFVLAGSLLILFAVQRSYRLVGGVVVVLFFSVVNLGAPSIAFDYPPNPAYKPETLAVFDASRAISRYSPDVRARFWYDVNDPQGQILYDVVATYLYEYRLVNDQFPRLVAADGRRSIVAPGQRIMLLTSKDEDATALASAALADQHLFLEQVAKVEIRRPGIAFSIFVDDVRADLQAARAVSLETMRRASQGALLQRSTAGIAFHSPAAPWTYVGRMPLLTSCLEGGGWVAAEISMAHGIASVGVLNHKGDDFLDFSTTVADDKAQTIFVRLGSFATAGDLILRNGDERTSAEGVLQAIKIIPDSGQTPTACDPDPGRTKAMAQARFLSLQAMTLGSDGALLRPSSSGVMFRSPPDPWSYIGRMPLLAGCLEGGGWIAADIDVKRGTIGIGVLDRKGDDFLDSGSAAASDQVQTIFLRLDSFAAAGDLILRNWDERSSSEGVLRAVRIAVKDGQTPPPCDPDPARAKAMAQARSLSLETMKLGSPGASLLASADGVEFSSAPDPWSYIGRMPLLAECVQGGGWLAANVRVMHGMVGIGVLNRKGDDFLVSTPVAAGDTSQTVFLRLGSFAAAGDLVVRNWDKRSSSEGTLQRIVIASEDGKTPAICGHDPAAAGQAHFRPPLDLHGSAISYPLDFLRPQNGGAISAGDGSIALTTSPQQWAYAASAPMALPPRTAGPGVLRVRLQVEEGKLGIGVFARDHPEEMLAEQAADVTGEPIDVDVNVADVTIVGSIVFRSWSPSGSRTRARILSMKVLLQAEPLPVESQPTEFRH